MTPRLRRVLKVSAIAIGVLGALIFGCVEYVGGLADGMCGNYFLHDHVSPDGKLKVVVFQRDCGATTGFSTQASLLAATKKLPNESGNIFVAIVPPGGARGPGGGPNLDVRWVAPQHLVLTHDQGTVVNLAQTQHSGVLIEYQHFGGDGRPVGR